MINRVAVGGTNGSTGSKSTVIRIRRALGPLVAAYNQKSATVLVGDLLLLKMLYDPLNEVRQIAKCKHW